MISENEPPQWDSFVQECSYRLPLHCFSETVASIPVQLFGINIAEVSDWSFLETLLSPEERQRSTLMRNGTSRKYFLAGRALLRSSLAYLLNTRPCEIVFGYSSNGKPYILGAWEGTRLSFNVSHAGSWALIAFSTEGDVGVDIEPIVSRKQMHRLLPALFSHKDKSYVLDAHLHEQEARFCELWCRREAILKAFGKGARYPTKEVNWSSFDRIVNLFRWAPSGVNTLLDIALVNLSNFDCHKAVVVLVWRENRMSEMI